MAEAKFESDTENPEISAGTYLSENMLLVFEKGASEQVTNCFQVKDLISNRHADPVSVLRKTGTSCRIADPSTHHIYLRCRR